MQLTPSTLLHIYYLAGRVGPIPDAPGAHFIGNWEEEGYSFLFFSRPSEDAVKSLLDRRSDLTFIDAYQMRYEDWLGERFQAFRAGGFTIVPATASSGVAPEPAPDTLVLDPGVVFGTGTHPTTRHCLEMMATAFASGRIRTAVDAGTGTGLLALAAARSGCPAVLAFDANLLAVETARRNIHCNGLDRRIIAAQARAEEMAGVPCDLLMANIHFDVMRRMLDHGALSGCTWFLLSGLLRSEAREIRDRLAAQPVEILQSAQADGIWHTFLGRRTTGRGLE